VGYTPSEFWECNVLMHPFSFFPTPENSHISLSERRFANATWKRKEGREAFVHCRRELDDVVKVVYVDS